ncbi:MAG: ABC transporter permease [Sphingobacteriales bacterium]|nr:MAG: ABC transporter permease [Sphingobacteriales bacterium]
MLRITRYVVYDLLRNKVSLAYTLFLFLVSVTLFRMEENGGKAVISLLNIVLIVIPLISIVFATIQWYNSYEFVELMLTQPVGRTRVLLSEYAGISGALSLAFLLGVGMPVLLFQCTAAGLSMLLMGVLLTCAFTSIAFFASIRSRDKARGIGVALMLWFYFALIYDGLVLLLLFAFSDYPLEKLTMLLSARPHQ